MKAAENFILKYTIFILFHLHGILSSLFASLRDALIRHCRKLELPQTDFFTEILGLIILWNYFTFQDTQFYHQLSGTAMGASMSLFFANAFMYYRPRPDS